MHNKDSCDIFIYNWAKRKVSKKDTFATDGLNDDASDSNFVNNLFKIFVGSKNSRERIPFENICSRI